MKIGNMGIIIRTIEIKNNQAFIVIIDRQIIIKIRASPVVIRGGFTSGNNNHIRVCLVFSFYKKCGIMSFNYTRYSSLLDKGDK